MRQLFMYTLNGLSKGPAVNCTFNCGRYLCAGVEMFAKCSGFQIFLIWWNTLALRCSMRHTIKILFAGPSFELEPLLLALNNGVILPAYDRDR